jgi:hypothetical protein
VDVLEKGGELAAIELARLVLIKIIESSFEIVGSGRREAHRANEGLEQLAKQKEQRSGPGKINNKSKQLKDNTYI